MAIGFRILPSPGRADPKLLQRLRALPVSNVSDNMQRSQGTNLEPMHRSGRMVGTAFTVRTRPGDNLMVHKAIDMAAPGDVIVVDAGGALENAIIGELMAGWAQKRGLAGFVIDGAIRDSEALAEGDFAVYAAGVTHCGPYKDGPGEINVVVTVGGMVVRPGDLVAGDHDGVRGDRAGGCRARHHGRRGAAQEGTGFHGCDRGRNLRPPLGGRGAQDPRL